MITDNALLNNNKVYDDLTCSLVCPAYEQWTNQCGPNEQANLTTCLCECIPDACGPDQTRASFANGCGCECITDSCGPNQARNLITDSPACGCVCNATNCPTNQVKNPFPSCECACTTADCPERQVRTLIGDTPSCGCVCENTTCDNANQEFHGIDPDVWPPDCTC